MFSVFLFCLVCLLISSFQDKNPTIEISTPPTTIKPKVTVTARLAVYDQLLLQFDKDKTEWWHGTSCSLDIRQATPSSSCCLMLSKNKKPLHGGAYSARLNKLKRNGILM